jgi:hypothetical protein
MSNLISGIVKKTMRMLKLGGRRHKKTAKVVAGRRHKKTAGRRHRKH